VETRDRWLSAVSNRKARLLREDVRNISVARVLLIALLVFTLLSVIDAWHVVEMQHLLSSAANEAAISGARARLTSNHSGQTASTDDDIAESKRAAQNTLEYLLRADGIPTYSADIRGLPNGNENTAQYASRAGATQPGVPESLSTVGVYVEAPVPTLLLGWLDGKQSITVYAFARSTTDSTSLAMPQSSLTPVDPPASVTASPTATSRGWLEDGVVPETSRVRAGPDLSAPIIARIEAGGTVKIIGRDEAGYWLRIIEPASGWIYAPLVVHTGVSAGTLPVVATVTWPTLLATPTRAMPTPAAPSTPITTSSALMP
jgi:Bacterial SH3 domain